jgi:hypothetical protein
MDKQRTPLLAIIPCFLLLLVLFLSNKPGTTEPANFEKIENTLKSVSLFHNSTGKDVAVIKAVMDRMNAAVAAIGYPDAGYQVWSVQSSEDPGFEIMVEGRWPDQETYQRIHDHELYQKARVATEPDWEGMESTWYHRFTKVR